MATKLTVASLLARNKALQPTHTPFPTFAEIPSLGLDVPHILVLTCVDPRCVPERFLDLKPGEGVLAVRNVCGHAESALPNIIVLDKLLGLSDVLVVHHTDCGALLFKDEEIRGGLKKSFPQEAGVDEMKFGGVTDLAQSVRDDVAIIKSSPLVRKELVDSVQGFVYDIKTGALEPVVI